MARYTRLQVFNTMQESGMVVVFYHPEIEVVKSVAYACAEGGARVLEFTHRGDFAADVFAELEQHAMRGMPQLVLGAGSIVEPHTAIQYINNGSSFVVSPLLNSEITRACNRRKIAYVPGCATLTEIGTAEELGAEIVKIFPGREVGGPGFVKSIRLPCPWTSIMPTGGVEPTEASLRAWFEAGVSCVGLGSQLVTKELLDARDYKGITRKVQETLTIIKDVRESLSATSG